LKLLASARAWIECMGKIIFFSTPLYSLQARKV